MSIIRIEKNKNYTIMGNFHLRERNLSLQAKGLMSLMLSLPEEWDFSVSGLATLSKNGKDSITSALKELETFGYLKRTRAFDVKGRFAGFDYVLFEEPQTEKPFTENPSTEKPSTENPTQLNIYNNNNSNIYSIYNKLDTKEVNKDNNILVQNAQNDGNNDETNIVVKTDEEVYFNEFWKQYPKKKAKKDAHKAFMKIKNLKHEFPSIMRSVINNRDNNPNWKREKGQYIPFPATFLNGERWKDEETTDTTSVSEFRFKTPINNNEIDMVEAQRKLEKEMQETEV